MKSTFDNYHKIIGEVEDYAFLLLDENGIVQDWNKGVEKLKGYTAEEITGQNFRIFYNEEDRKNKLPEKLIEAAIADGKAMNEGWRVRKDGSCFWGSILITALHDDKGTVNGFQKITRDLTERKKLEDELRQLNGELEQKATDRTIKLIKANRLYAFISAVNQAIVHINSEQELLDNICKIALEIGKFKMAWIGMLDNDCKLNMVSVHGDTQGIKRIMKHSGLRTDDPIMKDVIIGRVLRTGKYEYCNDMQSSPAYEQWRDEFISQGIYASIALPIIRGGVVVGGLSLQAGSKDFFDEEEVKLLNEAVGDISFALDNFDKEKQRHLAEEKVLSSEAKLKQAQSVAHVGSWENDMATGISVWSDEACRIFGVPIEENIQSVKVFLALIHPDDLSFVKKSMQESNATHTDNSIDHRIVRKDGTVRYIHTERRFELDKNGNVIRLYGVTHDVTEMKEIEEKIRRSESRLNQAQALSHLGSWEVDFSTGISKWSEESCRIYGLEPTDDIQSFNSWISYIHPEDLGRIMQLIEEQRQSLDEIAFDHRIVRKDSSIRHIHAESKVEFDNTGRAISMYGISHDITEKKRDEELLLNNIALFSGLFESAPEAVFIGDCDSGKFIDCNSNAISLFGYSHEELLERNPATLSPEFQPDGSNSAKKSGEMVGRAMGGEKAIFEWVHLNSKRDEIYCEVRLTKLDIPGRNLVRGSVIDISEKIRALKQKEFDKSNLDALINNTNDYMWSVDTDFKLITYNQPLYDIIKQATGAELIQGADMTSYAFSPEQANSYKNYYKRAFAGESFTEIEKNTLPVEVWSEISFCPIWDGNQIIGAACHSRDISERRKVENEIQELNEHLEERVQERTADLSEANKALEAFSYSVSHDLRAPVRSMVGFTKIIKQDYGAEMAPEQAELFGYIEESGKHMNSIIDDLLKLAKYGKGILKKEPVDMGWLINGVWLNIGRTTPHHATLELSELPVVEMDMGMMQQVVVNLLTNAIKYSSKTKDPVVKIWCETGEEFYTFYFKDNGAGFDMKDYDRLFGAFQRLHNMNEFEGTGVGLTLVKRIIEKHGGTIAAEAEVDKGATFYFTLPRS